MKSLFNPKAQTEIIQRLKKLEEDAEAQWGKMNVSQMLRHCNLWEKMIRGEPAFKQSLLGFVFGRFALKRTLRPGKPLDKNIPTAKGFVIRAPSLDFEQEKAEWLAWLKTYPDYVDYGFIHPFFGKMTKEQIGQLAYKHADHHLRQFGC